MATEVAADNAEIASTEAHDVASVVDFLEPDELVAERPTDEHNRAPPLDSTAVAADAAHLVIRVIPRLSDAFWKRTQRRPPVFGRRLQKRLVRPLLVVVRAERIESRLLLNVMGTKTKSDFEHRNVLFMDDGHVKRKSSPDDAEPCPQERTIWRPPSICVRGAAAASFQFRRSDVLGVVCTCHAPASPTEASSLLLPDTARICSERHSPVFRYPERYPERYRRPRARAE